MKITEISIKRPITIFMAIIAVLLFGVVSYSKLQVDMLPSIDLPMAIVVTQQNGTGPEEIESLVTKPLEGVLGTVSNVKKIRSISSEGSSTIIIEFEGHTDMNFATLEMREKVDMIKPMLPKGVASPMIMKMNPNMMPIMNFGVSIEGISPAELTEWTDKVLKPSLERVEGVASVDVTGSVENRVNITFNNDKLSSFGLNITQVMQAVQAENMNMPITSIGEGDYSVVVRTENEVTSLEDIRGIIINTFDGRAIKLGDVAEVEFGEKLGGFSQINGQDALLVNIQKESNANTVEVSEEVNKALDKLCADTKNLEAIKIIDQAEFVNLALSSVKQNAVLGAILAVLIIFLFLKDIRTTLVMGISIPISIISTFIMVYFSGLTLNMISLGGMALGVGMLVDNAIVVIENIYRLKKLGYSNKEASLEGTKGVGMAITASTLTSICVFLPIVFVQGVIADIFKELALTVAFSLVSSLIVSFTLVPLLTSKLLTNSNLDKKNKVVEGLKNSYRGLLVWSLDNKKKVLGMLVLSIVLGIFSFKAVGMEFFPSQDQGIVMVNVNGPKGSSYENIVDISNQVIDKLDGVEGVSSKAVMANKENATIYLMLAPQNERNVSDKEVSKVVSERVDGIAGAEIETSTAGSMSMSSSPISLSIWGQDFDTLDKITDDVINKMEVIPGIKDISSTNEKGAEEIVLRINKEKADKEGLSTGLIMTSLQGYFKEVKLSTVEIEDKNYSLVIAPETSNKPSLSTLNEIIFQTPTGAKIPFSEVVTLDRGESYSKIFREDSQRMVTISAGLDGRVLGDVVKDIEKSLEGYELPMGYKIDFGGEVEQMKDSFFQLLIALLLAVLLVYMVMAAQFESLISPFIIMVTVPISFVGALLALFIFNVTLSIPAMIGFIMLAGIIVNNGIVLVDYVNKLRGDGLTVREAIIEAGPTRLQPILMTALTTIIGLLPMAIGFGEGAEITKPLAMTVIGGLVFATFLTLVLVPVIYSVINRKEKRR